MFIWATVLFCLGVAAFLDNIFAFGEIFRKINTVMFMLVSLGLLLESKQIGKKKTNQPNFPNSRTMLPPRLPAPRPERPIKD